MAGRNMSVEQNGFEGWRERVGNARENPYD
jgi:hypothetical protein